MQHNEQPTEPGFYWCKRPPYVKGFWWQKKTTITPDWEMCFVNKAGMHDEFAVVIGAKNKLLSFRADVDWYGPISHPEELDFLKHCAEDIQILQNRNLERASTD